MMATSLWSWGKNAACTHSSQYCSCFGGSKGFLVSFIE